MFKYLFALVTIISTTSITLADEHTGIQCFDRAELVKTLEIRYNERLTGIGLQNSQVLIEIWSSRESGSFTMFVTVPNGRSCVFVTGTNWMSNVEDKE